MPTILRASRPSTLGPIVHKLTINPGNSEQFARTLARCAGLPRPRLLINCAHLPCLRTHGLAHLVSHLLLLHRLGAKVMLHQVSPALHRYLRLLKLDTVFRVLPPAEQPGETAGRWLAAA